MSLSRSIASIFAACAVVCALPAEAGPLTGQTLTGSGIGLDPSAAVVGAGTVFWAVSTAAVGLSQSYWQCAIWRAINGVGLAIVVPAVQSFIADR